MCELLTVEAHLTAIDTYFLTLQELTSFGHFWALFAILIALSHLNLRSHAHLMYPINLAATKKVEPPKEEEKPQKKRVKKDPNAPKKPMPPFSCY